MTIKDFLDEAFDFLLTGTANSLQYARSKADV